MDPEFDQDDRLWNLLSKARSAQLPPGFTDRVLQSVESLECGRQEWNAERAPESSGVSTATGNRYGGRLLRLWRIPGVRPLATGLAAVLLLTVGLQSLRPPGSGPTNRPANALMEAPQEEALASALLAHEISAGDLALLAHLDEVVDAELASLWTETIQ
jgi:hypothetical protein